jgi:excisionase family DNA binding protein
MGDVSLRMYEAITKMVRTKDFLKDSYKFYLRQFIGEDRKLFHQELIHHLGKAQIEEVVWEYLSYPDLTEPTFSEEDADKAESTGNPGLIHSEAHCIWAERRIQEAYQLRKEVKSMLQTREYESLGKREYLTASQVAKQLQISTRTLTRRIDEGSIQFYKVGNQKRFSPTHIEEYLEKTKS